MNQCFYDSDGNLLETEFIVLEPSSPLSNMTDCFFFVVENIVVLVSVVKAGLLLHGQLFVVVAGLFSSLNGGIVFDSLEQVVNSPRMLAVFTLSFLAHSKFIGTKNSAHAF